MALEWGWWEWCTQSWGEKPSSTIMMCPSGIFSCFRRSRWVFAMIFCHRSVVNGWNDRSSATSCKATPAIRFIDVIIVECNYQTTLCHLSTQEHVSIVSSISWISYRFTIYIRSRKRNRSHGYLVYMSWTIVYVMRTLIGKNLNGSIIKISSFVNVAIDTITNDTNDTKIESIQIYYIKRCDVDSSEGMTMIMMHFITTAIFITIEIMVIWVIWITIEKRKKVAITVPFTSITIFIMKNQDHNKTTIWRINIIAIATGKEYHSSIRRMLTKNVE